MATEAPVNEWETAPVETPAGARATGVYGAERIPGTYLKTLTGVQRGEELFYRPDLERPWRTTAAQRHAATVALKEKEIEELLRKCSSLRTQLGNAKHDAKYAEYAITEKSKVRVVEVQQEVCRLETALKAEKERYEELKTATEHQVRLLKAHHEKDLIHLRSENSMLNDRCAEITRISQQRVDDVKNAAARELEHVESICNIRVEELGNELKAVRAGNQTTEERHSEELIASKRFANRVEADYKERVRAAEERVDMVRAQLENENRQLADELKVARNEASLANERAAVALAEREDMLVRFKQWDAYILRMLDAFHLSLTQYAAERVVEPHGVELYEAPSLYAPRHLLEDPEAKVAVERIVYRLLQLKHTVLTSGSKSEAPFSTEKEASTSLEELSARQERLLQAFQEIEARCMEAGQSLSSALSRLYFFSDDLEKAIAGSGTVAPPQKEVVFVCLCVSNGIHLWTDDAETARASVALMNSSIRPKMAEYGAYECYSDGASMLLAFGDPVAACRFCSESQCWLMNLPWPQSLLRSKWGIEERGGEDSTIVFRGLRVAMAIHTGKTFIEPTAIPCGNSYRCHYYGRAVSQVIHICSLAQGGQVLVTKPVWDMCGSRRHELGILGVFQLGVFPIISFSAETNSYEDEPLLLYQILPKQLKDRRFQETVQAATTSVSPLAKMRRSIVSVEIECVEARRAALEEAVVVVSEELAAVESCIHALTHKAREVKSYFRLLPPPEMVVQMNDLYSVMEKVAARASGLRDDLREMKHMQEELAGQVEAIKHHHSRETSSAFSEEEWQARGEILQLHYEERLREMHRNHTEVIERIKNELRERDQSIVWLFEGTQSFQKP